MRTLRIRDLMLLAVVTVIMSGWVWAGCGEDKKDGTKETAETTEATSAGDDTCTAPASWFPHEKTPQPNDSIVFTTNCEFHRWSWQTFLWLTQTMPNGQLRFEAFANPSTLLIGDGTAPAAFAPRPADAPLRLMPRTTKSEDPTLLNEINQAGSNGIVIDQNGRAVYFSMYINDVFYNFVRENGLYDPVKFAACPDSLEFPVGSMELKAAWKIVSPGDNTKGIYTRKAIVNKLVEQNGTVVVDPTQTEEVTVALVGLHIAGVTGGHPEFIWATFEHNMNAPTLTDDQLAQYLDGSNTKINTMPVSDKNWNFYKAGTTFIHSNQNNADDVKLTDAAKQTLTPITNAFLQYAQGGGKSSNRQNIQTLNKSVLDQLDDSIFSNYYLGGAIWLKDSNALVPNSTQQDLITGSTELSNVTMETFTQKVKDQRNCFNCHNTMQRFPQVPGTNVKPLPGKNLNVSHILVNNYFQSSQRLQMKSSGSGK